MKNNKGITLIALVITIIVMLILVGVTINMSTNGGIFDSAKNAKIKQDKEQIREGQFMNFNLEYMIRGQEINKDIEDKLIDIVSDTGISMDKLVVYAEKKDGEQNIYYRLDKVENEEKEKLKNNDNIKGYFKCDINQDGILDENDLDIYTSTAGLTSSINDTQKQIADLNGDGIVDIFDVSAFNNILSGVSKLSDLY